jgi:nuclear pore complex protein Nup98-Nup96
LTHPEYYTEPTLDELEELFNAEGICRLEGGLTIGRLGYGSVFWKGPIELREQLNLDEIVHFRNKEVVVYPDDSTKPEIGCGLNKQAEVSLERIWPINPKTKQMIKVCELGIKISIKLNYILGPGRIETNGLPREIGEIMPTNGCNIP